MDVAKMMRMRHCYRLSSHRLKKFLFRAFNDPKIARHSVAKYL